MKRWLLCLLCLLWVMPALAAEVTHTPTMLRPDIDVGYRGDVALVEFADRLDPKESFARVGNYVGQRHAAYVDAKFSVYHGIALHLDIPIVPYERVSWLSARAMRYDLDRESPTLRDGPVLAASELVDSRASRIRTGLGDIGFGARFVPFGPGMPDREAPVFLAIDVLLRFPSGENFDRVRGNGTVGPGEGGMGVELGLATSRRVGFTEPYVAARWRVQAPYLAPLIGADGQPLPDADEQGRTQLDPADSVELAFGAEIVADEDVERDTSMVLDLGLTVTYRGPDEVSSGTRLPAPLDATLGHVAVESEHLLIDGRFGLRLRPNPVVELRVDLGGGWISPHSLERVSDTAYSAQSGGPSFRVRGGLGVRIRPR